MRKKYYAIKSGDRYKHFPDGNWNTELDKTCLFSKKSTAENKMQLFADEIVEVELVEKTEVTRHGKWVCARNVDTDYWRACEYFNSKDSAILAANQAIKNFERNGETNDIEDILGFYPDENEKITTFAVGQCMIPTLYIDTDGLLEAASGNVYDQCGEYADDYLDDVSKDHLDELEKVILEWFERHNYMPSCYTIEGTEEIKVED
ncbi:hypothetical protein RV11_GL003483 [Enterococcus phoeniculicola]|uniref:Uncharacterized protein n=1 Tax=Enterococcus phoeniculicola ATCC BAA-412 TaxID=1158610 RepID=R3TLY9_9ENTE|nr:hypothetical protein [Enterococcus phoeniculicola]EOL42023.1 hypothetical protein UC3_02371 [Enterococcus phoeniculicola ATCC BAA-412]EOT79698.1 hypothetical protein I589_01210 [Enterococcus phoeniculicola ATCC BAA-412]OJG71762.1 hypothetical protein RV11_GL003483 [Enterococcus phoeniculicola]